MKDKKIKKDDEIKRLKEFEMVETQRNRAKKSLRESGMKKHVLIIKWIGLHSKHKVT
jgi:hypothetical protein